MTEGVVQVPGYRIIKPLGEGGMASVFLALHESLDREVALKVMSPALASNESFCERFLKEGRITAKLRHQHLVTVFDIGAHDNTFYLATEYIPGGTLRDRMNRGLSIAEALDILRDIAAGLHYAHQLEVVHRDVKPGNILFRANGEAVLADFGIAKAMGSRNKSTMAGNTIGTPHYMSPEQARAEELDGRSDLYSLGAVFYEMITGVPPYRASDPFTVALMHVTHPPPQLPGPMSWLQPLIDGCMAKRPEDRYADGETLIAACEKLIAKRPEGQALRDQHSTRKRSVPRLAPAPEAPVPSTSGERQVAAARGGARTERLYKLVAAAAVLVLVAVLAWQWLQPTPVAPPPTDVIQDPGNTQPPTDTLPPTDITPPTTVEVPSIDSVDDIPILLKTAEEYVSIGLIESGRRMTAPPGDNAVALFRRVLEKDPMNEQAHDGLHRVAEFFLQGSRQAYAEPSYFAAQVLAEKGLLAEPDNAELQDALNKAKDAFKASATDNQ